MKHPDGSKASVSRVIAQVAAVLDLHKVRNCHVCVGLSGGLDSVVLLSALSDLAVPYDLSLGAVHVDHGLSPHAAHWSQYCRELCERLGVTCFVEKVSVNLSAGLGLEAAARRKRYAVYSALRTDYVALAHHVDDQVETLLIQLLRGAGPAGLSAMPIERSLDPGGPQLLRPLLSLTRSDLQSFAAERNLKWVEDTSNADLSIDRNFLRHTVLPLLRERFPAYRSTLWRASRNLADVAELVEVLARQDLEMVQDGSGLRIAPLKQWPPSRALNVLRYLFRISGKPAPHRSALEEALRQAIEAQAEAEVRVDFGEVSLRRYRDSLFLVENVVPPANWQMRWNEQHEISLPIGLGSLCFRQSRGVGVAAAALRQSEVTVRFRSGAARMALALNRPHRELRKLYQDAGVAPWMRERTPLVFCGTQLVWVPQVGIAAEFQATPGEAAYQIKWVRDNNSGLKT